MIVISLSNWCKKELTISMDFNHYLYDELSGYDVEDDDVYLYNAAAPRQMTATTSDNYNNASSSSYQQQQQPEETNEQRCLSATATLEWHMGHNLSTHLTTQTNEERPPQHQQHHHEWDINNNNSFVVVPAAPPAAPPPIQQQQRQLENVNFQLEDNIDYQRQMEEWNLQRRELQLQQQQRQKDAAQSKQLLDYLPSCYYCGFCVANGEIAKVYLSHNLKDPWGRVICPVLFGYTCGMCGATGSRAHTIKYCPMNRGKNMERPAVRLMANGRYILNHNR